MNSLCSQIQTEKDPKTSISGSAS